MYLFRQIFQYLEEYYFSSSLNGNYENLHFTKTATTLLMLVGGLCLGILIASFVCVFERRVTGRFLRRLLEEKAEDPKSAKTLAELSLTATGSIKRDLSRAGVARKLVSVVDADGSVRSYEDELAAAFPDFSARPDGAEADAPQEVGNCSAPNAMEGALPLSQEGEADALVPEADRMTEAGEEGPRLSVKDRVRGFFFDKKFKLRSIDFATARFFIPQKNRFRAELRSRKRGSSPWLLLLATLLVLVLFFVALRFIPAFVNMLDATISNVKGG